MHFVPAQQRLTIKQDNMTADPEGCTSSEEGAGQVNGVLEGSRVCHESGRTHDPPPVRFGDGPVHARSKPKVVGVDDKPAHAASVAAGSGRRIRSSAPVAWHSLSQGTGRPLGPNRFQSLSITRTCASFAGLL